jgi:hypothetical protein
MPEDGPVVAGLDVTTETEWGYRCQGGHVHYCAGGEGVARHAASRRSDAVAVRRTVTYSPWEEVPDAT